MPRHPAAHLERALFYHSGEWEKGDTGGGERKRESVCVKEREREEREKERKEKERKEAGSVCVRVKISL